MADEQRDKGSRPVESMRVSAPVVARQDLAHVAVVMVGRNERSRLPATLTRARQCAARLLYVDSGSTDGSPEIAERAGVPVLPLRSGPHSAARGRQAGFEYITHCDPSLEFVQFVDADCLLDPAWLGKAVRYLRSHPRVAGVCGRRREQNVRSNFWSRLVDTDWDRPPGPIDALQGDCLLRCDVLREVGGWNPHLIAGEELDLAMRIRQRGWQLVRLDAEMTLHDIGIHSLRQYLRRCVRSGYAYAQAAHRYGPSVPLCRRRNRGNLAYGLLLPIALAASLPASPYGLVLLAAYAVPIGRVAAWRMRRSDPLGFAFLCGLLLTLAKFWAARGALTYYVNTILRRRTALMEYRGVSASSAAEKARVTSTVCSQDGLPRLAHTESKP